MSFKYSVCHPDKSEIIYREHPISADDVLNIVKNHPWREELILSNSIDRNSLFYNPSLEFTCLENGNSFTLTANFDKKNEIEFSLWYNRPKKVKILFGLLGEKEKMIVNDAWSFNFENAMKYLEFFVKKNYDEIEKIYSK